MMLRALLFFVLHWQQLSQANLVFGMQCKPLALLHFLGIGIGLGIAVIVSYIHRYFSNTASVDAAITLITPYIMYITAECFHFSGVLAVVSGGLYLSYRSADLFTYESRLYAAGLWQTLIFLLNGFVFI